MFKALRTVPVILDICRDIEELAPNAWMLNFTNPAGMITEAVTKYSRVRSVGLCNSPINFKKFLAEAYQVDRITSYNVCYTKLLRTFGMGMERT